MLKLEGNSAGVMYVAKNRFGDEIEASWTLKVKLAIAVFAGLETPYAVVTGDALRIVANLHDELTAAGILKRPAAGILSSFQTQLFFEKKDKSIGEISDLLMNAMISNIMLTQVAEGETRFVEWESGVCEGFHQKVIAMHSECVTQVAVKPRRSVIWSW